jgi:hypothetical protein
MGFCASSVVQVMAELRTAEWEVTGPAPTPRRPSFAKSVVGVCKSNEFSFAYGYLTFGLTPMAILIAIVDQ